MQHTAEEQEELARLAPRPRLLPLFWKEGRLFPQARPTVIQAKAPEITILHTNDLHASVDGRSDEHGQQRGGLARVATTVQRTRAGGPTLVVDLGDIVFGDGTWWEIQGIEAVAVLRHKAGCDLATIGNHDLERGVAGLRELLAGGSALVSANLRVEDEEVQRQIAPAYLVEIGGWRIGVTGLTTLSTYEFIPSRILRGITLTDPHTAALQVVAALEPLVESIVILSHLGFSQRGADDLDLAAHLAGSSVSLILGSHTHAALDPAPVVCGITICNAGAFSANVGEVILSRQERESISVRTRLIPQDETIPADPLWSEARASLARTFLPFHETVFPLPFLPRSASLPLSREREWALLARALRATGKVPASSVLMVPLLAVTGQLPEGEQATLAEIMTAYPSSEHLIMMEISGQMLRELVIRQASLFFYQRARPLLLADESELFAEQVEEQRLYTIVTTELIGEGGLGWGLERAGMSRSLEMTCLQVVRIYLTALQEQRSWSSQ